MREYYLSLIDGSRQGIAAVCLRAILRFFSWIYCVAVMLLRRVYQIGLFKVYDLGAPVISVGNITWGGVGKTPLVERLVRDFLSQGKKPVVLMRGYMPAFSWRRCGSAPKSDEAQLLREAFEGKVPVMANKDRVQGALMVPADYAKDVFILDDGFQHWRVKRDLNIVVVDALDPFGNGAVIPRGGLREPLSALRHADVCVISRADLAPESLEGIRRRILSFVPNMCIVEASHEPKMLCDLKTGMTREVGYLEGRSVIVLSGIGSPEGFERTIRRIGSDIQHHMIYSDHHIYQSLDIQQIFYYMEKHKVRDVITTAKDAVKLKRFVSEFSDTVNIFSLTIEMRMISGEEALRNAVFSAVHA